MREPLPTKVGQLHTGSDGRVVVVGSINIDHVITADAFPSPGETIIGNGVNLGLGGKGANQAVAAAICGADVAIFARVGCDAAGEMAISCLADRGVDVSGVTAVPDVATGSAWITVTPEDNTIVVVPGANARWDAAIGADRESMSGARSAQDAWPDGTLFDDALGSAAVTVAQLEVPLAAVVHAAARSQGIFILNAAPARALPVSVLSRCDLLIVNEHELRIISGADHIGSDMALVERAHMSLLRQGVRSVATTLGKAGAVLTDEHGTVMLPAFPADVVDTTGAGDAFTGVLAARLAAGDPLVDAMRWGMAAGSLAVRRAGAQESFPDRFDLMSLLDGSVTR